MLKKTLTIILFLFGLAATSVHAQEEPVLSYVNADGQEQASLTMTEIEALPAETFTTTTVWTEGDVKFSGPSLKTILDALEFDGEAAKLFAINDYAINIPVSELEDNFPIVAYKRDGKYMSIRDKGPLWVVYPYDFDESYRSETAYSRSIWQLVKVSVGE